MLSEAPDRPRRTRSTRPAHNQPCPGEENLSFPELVKTRRLELEWTQERLAEQMRTIAADEYGVKLPDVVTVANNVHRWEKKGKLRIPSNLYRELLGKAMGVPVEELGLTLDPDYARARARQAARRAAGGDPQQAA